MKINRFKIVLEHYLLINVIKRSEWSGWVFKDVKELLWHIFPICLDNYNYPSFLLQSLRQIIDQILLMCYIRSQLSINLLHLIDKGCFSLILQLTDNSLEFNFYQWERVIAVTFFFFFQFFQLLVGTFFFQKKEKIINEWNRCKSSKFFFEKKL